MKLADYLDRYIAEVHPIKPFRATHLYALRRLQRELGSKVAEKLKAADVIGYARAQRQRDVSPATINIDISYLRGALGYGAEGMGLAGVSAAAVNGAMPVLRKYGLIGTSRPRSVRPEQEQLDRLVAHFRERLPYMADIIEFQVASTRRISETCRLMFSDVDQDNRTCIVRDMKDPRHKEGNDHEFPLLGRAWEIVEARLAKWNGHPEARIFPHNTRTVVAAFISAKYALGIEGLHLHDLRREGASRLLEAGYSVPQVQVVTGHKHPGMLLTTYTRLRAADIHKGPAASAALTRTATAHPAQTLGAAGASYTD